MINLVLTVLFACEMMIRMIGVGVIQYWKQGFNAFDGLLVILSLFDVIFDGCMFLSSLPFSVYNHSMNLCVS
jgi:hypothetical protein